MEGGKERKGGKKEQVVETTCGSHEKTSKDSFKEPGKLSVRKSLFPRNILKEVKSRCIQVPKDKYYSTHLVDKLTERGE
jgi:hypothetical protein